MGALFRKLRCRRSRQTVCLTLFFMVVVSIISVIKYLVDQSQCNDKDSLYILTQLCDKFHGDIVSGNLCPHLCDYRTLWFDTCTNYLGGKQALKAKWMDEAIMLKSKKRYFEDHDSLLFSPDFGEFVNMVSDSVHFNFPDKKMPNAQKIFQQLWMDDVDKYKYVVRNNTGDQMEMWKQGAQNSLWSLIQQDEYLLARVYKDYKFFPNIIGSCGHFYAMEFCPSGSLLSPGGLELTGLVTRPWPNRARVARGLLQLVHSFDSDLDEPLHICDMKGENFGIAADGTVKAIDIDTIMTEKKLMSDLSYPNCTSHKDCHFFDCRGWCDISRKRCTDIRLNNNLQSLCEKILVKHMSNLHIGLLDSPPKGFEKITLKLAQCASPEPSKEALPGCEQFPDGTQRCPLREESLRYKADKTLINELLHLLKDSLKE